MTDKQSRPAYSGATRRGFLALAGTAILAGCNGFGGFFEDEPPTLDGGELQDALSTAPPTVPETVPVSIEESRLDETATEVQELLESVPTPFDSQEIPNGAIRDHLSRAHDEATAALDEAANAPSHAETMARLRNARKRARTVVAAWTAIDTGLTLTDVRETIPEIRDTIATFRGRWQYVGAEPVRAILVHAHIEKLVAFAGRRTSSAVKRYTRAPENPIRVGEFAGALEETRAALDDAGYLYHRYRSSLAESRQMRSGVIATGDILVRTLENRRENLPEGNPQKPSSFVDRDIEGAPVASAMTELYRGLDYADGLENERSTGQRTRVILSVYETLVRVRAFELLHDRVNSGDHVTVDSVGDVRRIRKSAIEAFEGALTSNVNQSLARHVLSQIVGAFEYADGELDHYDGDDKVHVEWLTRDIGRYVLIGALAQATPPTSADVTEVIRRAFSSETWAVGWNHGR